MDYQLVPTASLVGMYFTLALCVLLPFALCYIIWKRTKAKVSSYFIAWLIFLIFVLGLEQLVHTIVLKTSFGTAIQQNLGMYAFYGGFTAALFEEVGRFLAMKYVMKNRLDKYNALMFGAGYSGFEALVVTAMTYVNNITVSMMIQNGTFEQLLQDMTVEQQQETISGLSGLWTMAPYQFFMGGVERIFAMIVQISLSIIVYKAVKDSKPTFFITAFLIHLVVDFVSIVAGSTFPIIAAELVIGVISVAIGIYARKIYREDICEMIQLEQSKGNGFF